MPARKKDHAAEPALIEARKALLSWALRELLDQDEVAAEGTRPIPALEEALTHGSYSHENGGVPDFQRLEFLGDAVLQLCASELLFAAHPTADEGALTRLRRDLVSSAALARFAGDHGFGDAVALGRGKRQEGVNEKILANVAESVLAAVYLAGGLPAARRYTQAIAAHAAIAGTVLGERDPKEALQEWAQRQKLGLPEYEAHGRDGARSTSGYEAVVRVGELRGEGFGATKQQAEREAAKAALASRLPAPKTD
jgi:ribonuclease-3